jgi:hypothetical protein
MVTGFKYFSNSKCDFRQAVFSFLRKSGLCDMRPFHPHAFTGDAG